MACIVNGHEGEVTTALHFADVVAIAPKLQVAKLKVVKLVLTGPLKSFGPTMVTKVVTDEILETCVR